MSKPAVLAEPVLVGREKELQELQSLLNSAIEGKGKTVFVSGEAGSGKTRLVTEFLNRSKKQDVTTLRGWCLSNAAVPYFPFFEAFGSYFTWEPSGETKDEIDFTRWLKGLGQAEKSQELSPQVWKDQTFVAVAKTLASISDKKPIILFLDDLHWADSASLALVHYISRTIVSERVFLVATFRSEELRLDAEGRPHPLVETLRLMRRENLYKEIKLASLSEMSVSELAKSMLGGDAQRDFVEKLVEESQGNALFIVESVRMLQERNSLILEDEKWRLVSSELQIPEKIKDIILQRLGVLIHNQRRILEAASAVGEKFDPELLASIIGQNYLEVADALDIIARTTSLICSDGEQYRFDHAKSRDSIYEEIPPALKKGYHNRIAELLENESKSGSQRLDDLAYHFAMAGNKEKAVKYALAAGQDSLARWSNQEAIKHFTYIIRNIPEKPENTETRARAEEGLGDAYHANSLFKEAARIFEELSNRETGADRLRVLRKAMESTFCYGDLSHLMELVKEAEPLAAADRLENAKVLFYRGRVYQFIGKTELALEDYATALRVFEQEYSLYDVALVLIGMGLKVLRSVALFGELGDFRFQMEAAIASGLTFWDVGLFEESLRMFAKVVEIDETANMGDYLRLTYANAFSALVYTFEDNWEQALAHGLKALEFSKKTDSSVATAMVYAHLCRIYVRLGNLRHAEEYFDKLMKLPAEVQMHGWVSGTIIKAIFLAGKGQWEESNQLFNETLEQLKFSPYRAPLLHIKHQFAWALEKQGRFEEAKFLREENQRAKNEAEERFSHAKIQANLMVRKEVAVGEEFEMRFDIVNEGRKPALLVEVRNALNGNFEVLSSPPWCTIQNGTVKMGNKEIGAFQVNTAKLTLKSLKAGAFTFIPQAVYVDDLGETRRCNLQPVEITTNPPTPKARVPGRISSGTPDLDLLLLGGLPENYAIVLTAPSSDERASLIQRFLEAGGEAKETTFYVTADLKSGKALAEKHPVTFNLFICNPQADSVIQNLLNIYRLKGVENLTDIDIALNKAFRTLKTTQETQRRIFIEILSDVLLLHHAVNTRRWLTALLSTLKLKGFTILAVVDPSMHPSEELQAVLSVFDGEIRVTEKEAPEGTKQVMKVRKLVNQKYLDKEVVLDKEKLVV